MAAKLPLVIANLYAELLDLAEDDVTLGYPEGGYTRKVSGDGRAYWYFQRWTGRKRSQVYVGPETPELLEKIEDYKTARRDRDEQLSRRRDICKAIRSSINIRMDTTTRKILVALANAGAFQAGVILIGSHAYGTYAALLGRKFALANVMTADVDFAAVQIAAANPVSFFDVVRSVDKRFHIVPAAPGARVETKLKLKDQDYRVELLTPGKRQGEKARLIETVNFGAQPLPFLDFLIEDPIDAVVPVGGGILVKIPAPERYALHKLIVAQARERSQHAKRQKDLAQAEELLAVLREDLPEQLAAAWQDLAKRGRGYAGNARKSLAALGLSPKDLG
jgi:hypothetical protein